MSEQIIPVRDTEALRFELLQRRKVYENEWEDILERELASIFVDEIWAKLKLLNDTSQNIFRRIVREICTVYKEPASRIVGPEGATETDPRYAEIAEGTNLDVLMAEAHRLSKATTASFLHVRTSEDLGEVRVHIYTPDQVHVETHPDDPGRLESFAYMFQFGKTGRAWVYYDRERRLFLNASGQKLERHPVTGESYEQDNKYGVVPVVPVPAVFPIREFWRPAWNRDAYRANLIIGVLETFANNLVKNNSFKQIWLTGDRLDEKLQNQILDTTTPLHLGRDGKAGTLDLTSAALGQIEEAITRKVQAIANNYGISAQDFAITGNVQSGFALQIRNRALEEIRQSDIPLFESVERRLFETIRTVNNADFPDRQISEDAVLQWSPGEVAFPVPIDEELKRWEFEFKHRVSSPVDYLTSQNPDMQREEAMERLEVVREENRRLGVQRSALADVLGRRTVGAGPAGTPAADEGSGE